MAIVEGNLFERDWLKRWNMYSPKNIALKDIPSNRAVTYSELYIFAQRIAEHFLERFNIQHGDRVAVLSKNDWRFVPLYFAIERLGACLVPINFRLTAREIEHILNDAEPKLFLYQKEWSKEIKELDHVCPDNCWLMDGPDSFSHWLDQTRNQPADIQRFADENDPSMILYTSGTTGAPKGAMITPKMIFWNSINTSMRLNLTQEDVHISFLPFFHTGGWNVLLTPFLHRGARTLFLDKFDPDLILDLCEKENCTILFGVPTMMDMMSKSPKFEKINLKELRYAIVGGEPMPLSLIRTWEQKGIPIRQGYGLTEFGPNVFSLNEEDSIRKIGSIGFPNFYIEAKVVDENQAEVPTGEIGELILKGPTCTPGYWRNPEASQTLNRNGWLHTGDLVKKDEENYFYVVGRKKDMFISGGENVYPAEVEQFLRSHEKINDVAVIGVADEKWGEVGKAFIVLKKTQEASAEEILNYCTGKLAKYKIPKHYRFINELPKGDSGKILKRLLQDKD